MKISEVTKEQYKQLCPISWSKCNRDEKMLEYKIQRAADLGKVTHTYNNGCKVIRYHYFNLLADGNEIMTMWQDRSSKPYDVNEKRKLNYKPKVKKEQATKQFGFLQRLFG